MASKNDMLTEILQFFEQYEYVLKEAAIPRITFYRWATSFQSYESMRKAHTFIFGSKEARRGRGTSSPQAYTSGSLSSKLFLVKRYYDNNPPERWKLIKELTPDNVILPKLREACRQLLKVWQTRPKRIRGTE